MKKIMWIICASILFLLFSGQSYANVDRTNAFNFSYDCVNGQGTLNTDFNLWGHHHYLRQYKINQPGVIQISDASHTTVSRNSNISISGCGFEAQSCSVSSWSDWVDTGNTTVAKEIHITTQSPVTQTGQTLVISWSGSTENIEISGFMDLYSEVWKNVKLELFQDSIVLSEEESQSGTLVFVKRKEILFTNYVYAGKNEFSYTIASNRKSVSLIKHIFKRVGNGSSMSSTNSYDVFEATSGDNRWFTLSSSRSYRSWYVTGLDYWDYNQHHYTTTKVKLYPVAVKCQKTEFSDGKSDMSFQQYNGTLSGLIQPVFGWDHLTLNGLWPDNHWYYSLLATDALNVAWLEYKIVGEVGGVLQKVSSIRVSIKENDITLGEETRTISPSFWRVGMFPDMYSLTIGDVIKKKGNYQLVFSFFNTTQQIGGYEIPLVIYPNFPSASKSLLQLTTSANSQVANGQEMYGYKLTLKDDFWNFIYNKKIASLAQTCVGGWVWCQSIYKNQVLKTGVLAFEFDVPGTPTNGSGTLNVSLKSLAPWSFDQRFKIEYKTWDNTYHDGAVIQSFILDAGKNSFSQPYTAALQTVGNAHIWSPSTVQLMVSKSNCSYCNNAVVSHFKESLESTLADYRVQNIMNERDLWANPLVDYVLNYIGTTQVWGSQLQVFPYISYKIWADTILTPLGPSATAALWTPIILWETNTFMGVKIIWMLQGDGKQTITWQEQNISDISSPQARKEIKKQAQKLIAGMTSGIVVNGVKYVEWDVTLSWNQSYETLIVKNGNVTITGNITQNIGIIVLHDWDTSKSVYGTYNKGNIYIAPAVQTLTMIAYADGSLLSINASWILLQSSVTRSNILKNQLFIVWSLFTRNTIGWSLASWGNYVLPWGETTPSFDTALLYDLNALRTGDIGWDKNGNGVEDTEEYKWYSTILKYNSVNQTNPPKGFGQ